MTETDWGAAPETMEESVPAPPHEPETSEPKRAGVLSVLAWLAFFGGVVLLNTAPWWIPLVGGPDIPIEPGILDDPVSIAASIASSWVLFVIAAVLARRAGMTRRDLGLVGLSIGRFLGWTVLVIAGLVATWGGLSVFGGDNLHVIEPITRPPQGVAHWLLWIALAVTAGFTEEFMMRGYGIGFWIRQRAPRWPVAVAMSALFGALHLYEGRAATLVIGVWGLLFAWSFLRTGSLWPAIAAHTFIDAVAPVEFYL